MLDDIGLANHNGLEETQAEVLAELPLASVAARGALVQIQGLGELVPSEVSKNLRLCRLGPETASTLMSSSMTSSWPILHRREVQMGFVATLLGRCSLQGSLQLGLSF